MQTKFDENAYSVLLERIYSITPSVQNVGFSGNAYKPGLNEYSGLISFRID